MPDIFPKILSVGTAVPERVVTNKDFEALMDTTDDWITSRTGIRERHITPRENPVAAHELGAEACSRALEKACVAPEEIDAIICATFTPDYFFPSTACKIQNKLGCKNAFAFDLSAACAGFVYGLSTVNAFMKTQQVRTALLVGTEVISKTLDWSDRTTAILFGDAAGAIVLRADTDPAKGILSTTLFSNGALGDILYLPAWSGEERFLRMKGNEVFKHAVRLMSESSLKACALAGVELNQIDLVIPHQANIRIIQGLADHLKVPMSKVVCNLERFGNTSSASIPLAMEEAWNQGRITPGTCVLITGLGGGMAVGSAVVRF